MSLPSQKKINSQKTSFKHFDWNYSGAYSCRTEDTRLKNTWKSEAYNSGQSDINRLKLSSESSFTAMDRISQIQKTLSIGNDFSKLVSDSTAVVEKMNLLRERSSQIIIITQTIRVKEVSQLAVFLDETTVMIINQYRVIQQTQVFSNIDEVIKSINSLQAMLDSRLKRLGSLFAECFAALGRATVAFQESGKVKTVLSYLQSIISKAPRVQALFTRGISLIGRALSAIGIAIGGYQAYDKWQDFKETGSDESLTKAVIETIAFVVGIVLLIIAGICGGLVAIVIGVALLLYGLVDAYFSFKDPSHQDFIATGIHSIDPTWMNERGHEFFAFIDPFLELMNRFSESINSAMQKIGDYLNELYWKLSRAASELTDMLRQEVNETFNEIVFSIRDTLATRPQL